MITYEEAEQIARRTIPEDQVILPEFTEEIDLGWYFMHQTREYAETGDIVHMAIGHGGIVVSRADGEVLVLGSAYPKEYWFEAFRWGLQHKVDLEVTEVSDPKQAAQLVSRLDLTYVIPKEEYGIMWKIPQTYGVEQIRRMLSTLPCRFEDQQLIFKLHELQALRQSRSLVFTLSRFHPIVRVE